ncbi:AbrB/MazE/SpoVT family DNA-binding domain-containing protein [Bacillus paranthracis]|uniref:AbrB/MazE/SpoVT family DNA-binding domain-containing protein n=1 Tax=Bacillus paranthracis TaxID=2026186 RepID=A0A5M9H3J2_9BACI|nr:MULTISPECIES: AbrB/MazE/SpoVT family DNA-binding domain-containing protein [Bacillus]EJR17259.1 AbrB family transcriptional regulator [Bacillus cereus MSX-A12]MBQ6447822.1 AbrB/MazE/SpoVT family DNA-binding domain-containing protein [Bacillus sp. (in: firmicutes)]KAA8481190.1 AbrB/MazE/SpoVT family DNA-binding domain-containing protein [Bacillus paranthracis]KXI44380.1 AbrB family transcriptional regulator [Bacillus cereus]KXI58386.1 AbrB family transcriptional regulator [Bacillus cereus]
MKSTGIIRNIDPLGRIVVPMELRRTLGIQEKDPMEIFVDGESIILKKYNVNGSCQITGEVSDQNIELAGGKLVLSPEGIDQVLAEIESHLKGR